MKVDRKLVAGLVVLIAIVLGVALWFGVSRGTCSSHEDVTARVAIVSSALQQAAARQEISIEKLAEGIKRLNAAATTYETTKDAGTYCEGLDALAKDFKLQE